MNTPRFIALLAFAVSPLWSNSGHCANSSGVVVKNSTGEIITRCVEFEEDAITVEALLERSGFKRVTQQSSFGAAICYLHNEGNLDAENCFGHPLGWFWNVFVNRGGEWIAADAGISTVTVSDGDLAGFAYGAFGEATLPPMSFDDVCGYTGRAGVVVDYGGGNRDIRLVEFPGETLTGLQLLEKSGLETVLSKTSFGTAICGIGGVGQPADDCFGDPLGRFWGFNILQKDGSWSFSEVGVDKAIFRDGDVAGFHFAAFGESQPPVDPDEIFADASCAPLWEAYP